jgi:glutamate-ammonia-ligase adenylyltransferase
MSGVNLKDLLLSRQLDFPQVSSLLSPYGFKEIKKADSNLQLIADEPRVKQLLAEILDELLDCLSRSPDPDQALNYLERFARAAYSKTQLFVYLRDSPYTLALLAKLFGSSPFLSEILIRNPTYLYWITDPQVLEREKAMSSLSREVSTILRNLKSQERKLEALCIIKRRELLRIGVRDLLKKSSVEETTMALSVLAEILLQKVLEICDQLMQHRYGIPIRKDTSGARRRAEFTVLGMGKLGGGELNFSSDVDLLYLYDSNSGKTSGLRSKTASNQISNAEYFRRLSQEITSALSGITDKGSLYRVDLRLRPEGRSGQIAYHLKAYQQYYGSRGETWERMALVKAWPVAGSRSLGRQFIRRISSFIYRPPLSLRNLKEIRHIKERIDSKMLARSEDKLNVKLGTGGIREIEFIVQSLQIMFGDRILKIRERNTLKALEKLFRQRLLSRETYSDLRGAYIFLRNVEHSLQMVHEFQTHVLPDNPQEMRLCALRLNYRDNNAISAMDQFLTDYRLHTGRVNLLFRELFDAPENSSLLKAAFKRSPQIFSNLLEKK